MLKQNGAKKQEITNRKRISYPGKAVEKKTYQYPELFFEFLDQQRDSYNKGIREERQLFEKYCDADTPYLEKKCEIFSGKNRV